MRLPQWMRKLGSQSKPPTAHTWMVDGALIELLDTEGNALRHWRLFTPLSLSTAMRVPAEYATRFTRFFKDRLSALQQELTNSAGTDEAFVLLGGGDYRRWRAGELSALPLTTVTEEAFWRCFTTPAFDDVEPDVRIVLAFTVFEKRCELPAHA